MPVHLLNKKWRIVLSSLAFATLLHLSVYNQADAARAKFNEYQVKSVFLFNLAHFVFWPEESFSQPDSPFFITILGQDDFGKNLDEIIRNEKVGRHPIVLKRIKSLKEMGSTQILFIHRNTAKKIKNFAEQTIPANVLTVSDYPGFTAKGGAISLLVRKNRIILELNAATTQHSNYKISSKLLQVAKIVGKKSP